MLCFKYADIMCDGNKARAKALLRFYIVLLLCNYYTYFLFFCCPYFAIISMHF